LSTQTKESIHEPFPSDTLYGRSGEAAEDIEKEVSFRGILPNSFIMEGP
jgi:hypothetical protein